MRRYFRIQKQPMMNVEQYIQQNKLSETMGSIPAQTESPNKRRLYVCQDASTWGNIAPRRIPLKAICQLEERRGQGNSSARVCTHAAIFQNSKTTHDKCGAIHTTKQIKRDDRAIFQPKQNQQARHRYLLAQTLPHRAIMLPTGFARQYVSSDNDEAGQYFTQAADTCSDISLSTNRL